MNLNSMLYWWPRIEGLPIPKPRTILVPFGETDRVAANAEAVTGEMVAKVDRVISKFHLPVFLRTDLSSAKHSWERSCFYKGQNLGGHLLELLSETIATTFSLPSAFVVREYIPMNAAFVAFRGLPIGQERRYMVEDSKVERHFPYWPESAVAEGVWTTSDWRRILKELNRESKPEVTLLTGYAEQVSTSLRGYWSVDFCRAKDEKWILIDCARGDDSWQPKRKGILS